jgi:hypothetical protein
MHTISAEETLQHLKNLDVYGYTKIKNFASAVEVEKLLRLVNKHFDSKKPLKGERDAYKTAKFVYNLQNKDKYFIDVLADPFITEICMKKLNDPYYKFLPKDCPNYILSYYNARCSDTELPLHTDTFIVSRDETTWTMQMSLALEEATIDNGCLMLVPGSHLTGRFVDYDLEKLQYVEAKAGDLVMWDSRVWHGALENKSKKSRWSLIATFTTWWVKQRSDMTRGLPNEIYQQLTDRQKQLLGFCSIPPKDETERLNFKCGYDELKATVHDYY